MCHYYRPATLEKKTVITVLSSGDEGLEEHIRQVFLQVYLPFA